MDIEKLKKSMESRGWSFKSFATGAEAAEYLAGELAGATVGIGGCGTAEAIGLYDRLKAVCPDVAWHWKEEDMDAARARAMTGDAYVCSANAVAETGEIVNIDGMGNRLAGTLFGHKRVYIVAGRNKVCPDLDAAIYRARNVAAPLQGAQHEQEDALRQGRAQVLGLPQPRARLPRHDDTDGQDDGHGQVRVHPDRRGFGHVSRREAQA